MVDVEACTTAPVIDMPCVGCRVMRYGRNQIFPLKVEKVAGNDAGTEEWACRRDGLV